VGRGFEAGREREIKRITLAGYYGEGNLGDDALALGFLTGLRSQDVVVTALSGNPEGTQRALGIRAIARKNIGAINDELKTTDVLVFGGGGLLQDATSLLSLKYYTHLIHTAKKLGKKVALLGQGIGPVNSYLGKRAAAGALALCDLVCVRDAQSLQTARSLGANRAELTADLAWLVPSAAEADAFQLGAMKSIAVSARPWARHKVADVFGEFGRMLFQNGYVPVLVEMDRTMDGVILDTIAKKHGGRAPDIRNVAAPQDMLSRISRMHGMVAMRLHAGILAAKCGIAPLMVAYDAKVSSFAQMMGLPFVQLDGLSSNRLWDVFREFEANRDSHNRQTVERAAEQTELARKNMDLLQQIL
jgi:polysaccharide pyruvyl transferase CsaB